jgi:RNA polymerase sigma-70 factor (ECF subfamily)
MDLSTLDDEALLALIARSQAEALEALYNRYSRLVFGLALNALGERSLAEEVSQDVFLRVWQNAHTYQPGQGRVSAWLTSIARNRAIDIYRQRQVRPESRSQSLDSLPDFDPPSDQDVEQEVESAQQSQRVRRCLRAIPADQRQCLALAYFRGNTQEEIAAALGLPLGTVKTRIRLGMQKLRQLLSES